jgi:hypothetical protein
MFSASYCVYNTLADYRGGSGLSVLGPPEGGKPRSGNKFDNIISKAKQNMVEEDKQPAAGDSTIMITLYRNGFTLNDGALRDPSIPENQEFLTYLEEGRIPTGTVAFRSTDLLFG